MQADVGLNRILHNTQWIIGPHVHVAILVGLTMTLYGHGRTEGDAQKNTLFQWRV